MHVIGARSVASLVRERRRLVRLVEGVVAQQIRQWVCLGLALCHCVSWLSIVKVLSPVQLTDASGEPAQGALDFKPINILKVSLEYRTYSMRSRLISIMLSRYFEVSWL